MVRSTRRWYLRATSPRRRTWISAWDTINACWRPKVGVCDGSALSHLGKGVAHSHGEDFSYSLSTTRAAVEEAASPERHAERPSSAFVRFHADDLPSAMIRTANYRGHKGWWDDGAVCVFVCCAATYVYCCCAPGH